MLFENQNIFSFKSYQLGHSMMILESDQDDYKIIFEGVYYEEMMRVLNTLRIEEIEFKHDFNRFITLEFLKLQTLKTFRLSALNADLWIISKAMKVYQNEKLLIHV